MIDIEGDIQEPLAYLLYLHLAVVHFFRVGGPRGSRLDNRKSPLSGSMPHMSDQRWSRARMSTLKNISGDNHAKEECLNADQRGQAI